MLNLKKKQFFSSLGKIIWPIERSELKLFVPMSLMMLCVLFNFGTLRSIKDSLVVPNIGAEVISFLKLWLVLPSTIVFTLIYAKLNNMFDHEHVFYLIVSFFLGFFIFFTYALYPHQDFYHPSPESIQKLVELYPNFKWFALIAGKWSYALMYIFCELWSAVIINLLFWQYANNIFDSKSAKRFYPILGMIGNLGLVMAGTVLISFSETSILNKHIPGKYSPDQCSIVLEPIMITVIIFGCIAMILYGYINQKFVKSNKFKKLLPGNKDNTKTKLSVLDSIKLIIRSKYISHIGLLLLCYGLAINILEGPWKARVRELYPNTVDYINFMGKFNIWMGISCVVFSLIGSNILRKFSWFAATLITPCIISITGIIFFIFVANANDIGAVSTFNPIYLAVIIGAIQNILSKSTKYSLFDSTKEMTYIPLSLELRTKGKAAVEVVGLKFGKSLGAFAQSFIFILVPNASFDSVTTYLMTIFILIIILWIWNIKKLNEEYSKIKEDKE